MKRLSIMLAALVLLLTFAACGADQKTEETTPNYKQIVKLKAIPQNGVELEQEQMQAALDYIETLLDDAGRSDYTSGLNYKDNEIIIKFQSDVSDELVEEISVLPQLTFRDSVGEILMDGSYVEKAAPNYDQYSEKYVVNLEFTADGAQKFAEITEQYLNQNIAIYLDDVMLSNPTVNAVITGGSAQIAGDFDADEATALAAKINAAKLPLTLERELN